MRVRPHVRSVMLGAALLVARPAFSAAPQAEHLLVGSATPKDATLVAGETGARYELRGGALLELSPGTTFSFEPSIRLKIRKPGLISDGLQR